MQQTGICRIWCPKGSTPIVGSAPGKSGVLYSGFVILGKENGHVFVTKPDRFTYETTIDAIRQFLDQFPLPPHCRFHMILDNAPWHQKAKRLIRDDSMGLYRDISEKVSFVDIPPYSPDLNPIEILWRITRREITHNVYFPSLMILELELDAYFAQFQVHTEKIASLCTFNFDHPDRKPKQYFYVGCRFMPQVPYGKKIRKNNRVKTLALLPKNLSLIIYKQKQPIVV